MAAWQYNHCLQNIPTPKSTLFLKIYFEMKISIIASFPIKIFFTHAANMKTSHQFRFGNRLPWDLVTIELWTGDLNS